MQFPRFVGCDRKDPGECDVVDGQGLEHDCVRVADLAGPGNLGGFDQLISGRQDGQRRPGDDPHAGPPDRCKQSQAGRGQSVSRLQQELSLAANPPPAKDILAGSYLGGIHHDILVHEPGVLTHHRRVGFGRQGGPGHDHGRLTWPQPAGWGLAGQYGLADLESTIRGRQVRDPHGITVHERFVERRLVRVGRHVFGEQAAPAVEQRALGRRQRPGLLHHLCERLFDREHERAFRGALPPVLGQRPRDNAHCSRKFLSSLIPSRVRKLSG